jgi:hypothetical protein
MLVIPEEDYDHINSDNLSENVPKVDLKEFFIMTINNDKFIFGGKNELEMEKDIKQFKSE